MTEEIKELLRGDKYDDLEELRILMAKTQHNLNKYGSNLYLLKNDVSDCNVVSSELGYGYNQRVFHRMNPAFTTAHRVPQKVINSKARAKLKKPAKSRMTSELLQQKLKEVKKFSRKRNPKPKKKKNMF